MRFRRGEQNETMITFYWHLQLKINFYLFVGLVIYGSTNHKSSLKRIWKTKEYLGLVYYKKSMRRSEVIIKLNYSTVY